MRNLALLMMTLVALPASALTKVDLYNSQILLGQDVKDAKVADSGARIQGMKNVLVRASGDIHPTDNAVIKKALQNNSRYITQLSYSTQDQDTFLKMRFGAPQVRALLTQARLPFWPAMRPNVLVWVIEDNGYERQIDWEHSSSPILKEIKETAEQRGLPYTVPVGDFDDITSASAADFWGGFIVPMSKASQRYPADAVLVVKVSSGTQVSWTLYDQSPSSMTDTTKVPVTGNDSGDDAGTQMMNQISDYYAKKSGVVIASESSESVKTQFSNIRTAQDFFKLEDKLKGLSSVAALDVLNIQGSTVLFRVHLLASQDSFEDEVARMGQVTKVDAEPIPVMPPVTQPTDTADPAAVAAQTTAGATSEPATAPLANEQFAVDPTLDQAASTIGSESVANLSNTAVPEPAPVAPVLAYQWQG